MGNAPKANRRTSLSRLVIVSNRVAAIEEGKPADGGLGVAIYNALRNTGGLWFGWSGNVTQRRSRKPKHTEIDGVTLALVDLSQPDYEGYYNGFSNGVLWPLFHYRLDLMQFNRRDYAAYKRVNAQFAAMLYRLLLPDDAIWVHDYHLIPLGEELRRLGVKQRLGFFLHTPFPSFGVLAHLPVYKSLLRSFCAYDLVGFQTIDDETEFRNGIIRGAGGKVLAKRRIFSFDRLVQTGVFPIGVDTQEVAKIAKRGVSSKTVTGLKNDIGDHHLIIGVDRLDYSKGLEHKFIAFDLFLKKYPRSRERIQYVQIATPTRGRVPEYGALRHRLGALAGDIAGRYSELDWSPIQYLNRSFSRQSLFGFFRISRIGLVTPLRDGMNLVAMEYVSSQEADDPGILILSPFAGAAHELDGAVIVNPYDPDAIAEGLNKSLHMSLKERQVRWESMMSALRRNDITAWRRKFLHALSGVGRQE